MNESILLSLINDVYSAAENPELWPAFLEHLSDALNSKMSVLLHQDARNRSASVGSFVRLDPASAQVYEQHYAARNVFFTHAREPLLSGALLCDSDVDERTLLRSEYYGDFLEPHDVRHAAGLVVMNERGIVSILSTMRSRNKGAFTAANFTLLRALRPHVQRGFQLHRALCSAEERATLHSDALDLVEDGVVLLNARGQIAFMNRRATDIVKAGDGLKVAGRELRASTPAAQTRLSRLVADALGAACASHAGSGGSVSVLRSSSQRPYEVTVSPLRAGSRPREEAGSCVVVLIHDPEKSRQTSMALLKFTFGLTPAEVRLASRLMDGQGLSDAAQACSLSLATVRTHLKRIFAKTGTRHQSELVALLCTIKPGQLN